MTDIQPGDIVLDRTMRHAWVVDSVEHGVLRLTNGDLNRDLKMSPVICEDTCDDNRLALMPADKVERYLSKGQPLYSEMLCDVMGWTREAAAVNWWEYDPHDDQEW